MASAEQKDYYRILGVKRNAGDGEIRKAYRRLARKHHPDVNPGDSAAEDRFKNIQEAYTVLSDQKKRQMYDQFGFYSETSGRAEARGGAGPAGFDFGGFDFSDVFAQSARGTRRGPGSNWGGVSDLFSQLFSQGRGEEPQAKSTVGEDLEYTIDIGFWDAIRGTKLRLSVFRQETCEKCQGMGSAGAGLTVCGECGGGGHVSQTVGAMRFNIACPRCKGKGQFQNTCLKCEGDGRMRHNETVEVRIPAGAQNRSRLRVAGKGNSGGLGAATGDLYITTRVGSHPVFERKADDIHLVVPITIEEAVLGAKIEVPTIDGKALLKIPPATDSGKKFRLREKGVLSRRTSRRGNQFVEVRIVVPPIPDQASKTSIKEFGRLNPEDPREALWTQV